MRLESFEQVDGRRPSCSDEQFSSHSSGAAAGGEISNSPTTSKRQSDNDDIPSSHPSSNKRSRISKDTPSTKNATESKMQSKQKKKQNHKKKKSDAHLELSWICTECREAECATQPESPLLVCEGVCSRPFHYPCAGLAALPPTDKEWICSDCKESRHQCAVCHEYGADDVDVHKCQRKDCGLFFHEACLTMYDVDVQVQIANGQESANEGAPLNGSDSSPDGYVAVACIQFICPAHRCWTCSDGVPLCAQKETGEPPDLNDSSKLKQGKKKKSNGDALSLSFKEKNELLFRCLECPNAYHISCIPPHAAFHELALLCHEHATTSKLPYLDLKSSYQAHVENKTDEIIRKIYHKKQTNEPKKLITVTGDECNKWLPAVRGDSLTKYDREVAKLFQDSQDPFINKLGKNKYFSFCAPCSIQKEVHSKPPIYKHVHANQYDAKLRPKRHPPSSECCQCIPKENGITCDEHCMNRLLGIECIGNGAKKSGQNNPYWNCNYGQECGNRQLGNRLFAKCKPKREKGKGWGLITLEKVKKGNVIQEYVGEIIDEATKRERLRKWSNEHPNDPNFYVMSLESGWYIDAREKGNLSRFINHSCRPNCHLFPVNVSGHTRIAIIANCHIDAGEFLSYDYQFDTEDGDKFVCRCGAPTCRGTMKGGSNATEEDNKKKTKRSQWEDTKAAFEKDKKFLEELEDDRRIRLCQVGPSLPGEVGDGAKAVASLPNASLRSERSCLWRNTVAGSNFATRLFRITSKSSGTTATWNKKKASHGRRITYYPT
mmetsp:Transcript_16690/g.31623  ORF Transcript_16690/g.31623 Transcript_16690/m.31623 type:complete len:775 (-) Transcript_16690:249-2573(-)